MGRLDVAAHAQLKETGCSSGWCAGGRGDVYQAVAAGGAVVEDRPAGAAAAIIPLITFRDELRARLRQAMPGGGIAILAQATTAVSAYLADEHELGRIAADADIDSLTLALVGGGNLLFADRDPGPPTTATVNRFVTTVLADVVQRRPR